MTRSTPLVDPDGYFARTDAFSLRRAVGLVLGFWLGTTALGAVQRTAGDVTGGLPLVYPLQTLEATLLYWVVPTILLYGLGAAAGSGLEPADALALAAWWLVPLLAGEVATNLFYSGAVVLGIDPGGTAAEPALRLLGPLALLACGWAALVWRGGLRRGAGLERSTATPIAVLAAAGCAALLLLPAVVA